MGGSTGDAAVRLALVLLLVLVAVTPAASQPLSPVAQTTPEVDATVTRIEVTSNGSATWTLRTRTRLPTEERLTEYQAFQRQFRANTSRYRDPFAEGIRGIVADATNATEREMGLADVRVSTSIQQVPRRWGVVTYRFRWDGFAATTEERVVVGDVFQSGFFIAANDSLVLVAPDGYRVETAEPAPDDRGNGSVTWAGRENFADERPRATFARAGGTTGPTGQITPVLVGAAVVGTAALSALVVGYRRRNRGSGPRPRADEAVTPDDEFESSPDEDPEPLRTDEDRVEELLADHGGRMRQSNLGEQLGWSKSKTSRVLSGMAEDDRVEKIRLGRENVVERRDED